MGDTWKRCSQIEEQQERYRVHIPDIRRDRFGVNCTGVSINCAYIVQPLATFDKSL
jgi:hypothetical protein